MKRLAPAPRPAGAAAPPPRPAPPHGAQAMSGSGAFEQRMDDVARELRDALEPRHGRLEVTVYKLPASATFTVLADHYASVIAGWQAEPALPRKIRAAEARAWTTGSALFAIALIDKPVAGERLDYKLLVVATKP